MLTSIDGGTGWPQSHSLAPFKLFQGTIHLSVKTRSISPRYLDGMAGKRDAGSDGIGRCFEKAFLRRLPCGRKSSGHRTLSNIVGEFRGVKPIARWQS